MSSRFGTSPKWCQYRASSLVECSSVLPRHRRRIAMASYKLYQRDPITGHLDKVTELDCGDDIEAISLARPFVSRQGMELRNDGRFVWRYGVDREVRGLVA